MDNVSLQMIAEKSGISKSLLQSYYPHKAKLTNDIIRNLFNTLGEQVNNYDMANSNAPYARTKAFIYTIAILGMHDEGLDRIISEAFISNASLDNWGIMLNDWIKENHLFDDIDVDEAELETGIAFVTNGIGRLYHDRKKHHLSAEELADYATSALMYSFLRCSSSEIEQALKDDTILLKQLIWKQFTEQLIQCLMKVKKFSAKGESSWLKAKELICDE